MLKKINVNKIPLAAGLLFVLKDICEWAYVIYKILFTPGIDVPWVSGLEAVLFMHLPSSIFASIIQYSFFQEGNFASFYLLIFAFGLIQYFAIGLVIGLIMLGIIKLIKRLLK